METTNQTKLFGGTLKVTEIKENTDGSATVVFEADKDFREGFKKHFNLKRWSQKKFDTFMNQAIESSIKYYRHQEKTNKENHDELQKNKS